MSGKEETHCDCCQFEGCPVKEYDIRNHTDSNREKANLCTLCAGSFASNYVVSYPRLYSDSDIGNIAQLICYVGNAIIAEIKNTRHEPTEDK